MRPLILLVLLCVTLTGASKIFAQDYIPAAARNYSTGLSIEIDPVAFLFKGYSLHVRYQPMFTETFLIGLGTYGLDVPETFIDFNEKNRDRGWDVRIRGAFFIYGELYAKDANHGWFIGEQLGFQRYRVSIDSETSGSAAFNNLVAMTYVGYSWHPFKGSFYIKPWFGVGFTDKIDGMNTVGTMKYDIAPVFPFFAVHGGYTF